MTTTDTTTVTLADDSLTLVRLSREYLDSPEAYAGGLEALKGVADDDDRLVFYAAPSSLGPTWARLIVPEPDPRSVGMTQENYGVPVTVEFDRDTHLGWNLQRSSLRPVDVPKAPFAVGVEVDVEARIAEAVAEARREEQRKAAEWRERATRIAHQYADDNSLCSQFDLCMIEIGLEPRESFTREFSVEITETRTYRVFVEATNGDDAAEMAEDRVRNGYETPNDVSLEVDDVEEE
jgi:hypothetical protein